jgi:hypothetical protein
LGNLGGCLGSIINVRLASRLQHLFSEAAIF